MIGLDSIMFPFYWNAVHSWQMNCANNRFSFILNSTVNIYHIRDGHPFVNTIDSLLEVEVVFRQSSWNDGLHSTTCFSFDNDWICFFIRHSHLNGDVLHAVFYGILMLEIYRLMMEFRIVPNELLEQLLMEFFNLH
ncbi:hypothetical protein JTE90_011574 [Oedothorax gibbosus]|uniref:Uncharacterized protein n=1 Tax=Oedothorax gibbosus TaxID=931172 RepID=A0AAV6TUL6_9ARAC|nr:hypothetical protein JTE90_011574 [Oedothorax gibbosus]